MRLYKYKSLSNLWHVLDIIVNNRLYCAVWSQLNDPLEGRYEIYLGNENQEITSTMTSRIEVARYNYRIASLSADPTNFLMWSHYSDGHKGIVIEVDIPETHPELTKVSYSAFSSIFMDKVETQEDMKHLYNGKSEEWSYEKEYRLITENNYFNLPKPVCRILLGPLVNDEQKKILKKIIPSNIEIVEMELDSEQGVLTINDSNNKVQETPVPDRFKYY